MSLELWRFLRPDTLLNEAHPRAYDDDHIAWHRRTAAERIPNAVFAGLIGAAALVGAVASRESAPTAATVMATAGYIEMLVVGGGNYIYGAMHAAVAHAHERTPGHCQDLAPLPPVDPLL